MSSPSYALLVTLPPCAGHPYDAVNLCPQHQVWVMGGDGGVPAVKLHLAEDAGEDDGVHLA